MDSKNSAILRSLGFKERNDGREGIIGLGAPNKVAQYLVQKPRRPLGFASGPSFPSELE